MDKIWNYHDITSRLEIMARPYNPSISADTIDRNAFVDTMISVLMAKKLDCETIRVFSAFCSEYALKDILDIPAEKVQAMFDEFLRLYNAVL